MKKISVIILSVVVIIFVLIVIYNGIREIGPIPDRDNGPMIIVFKTDIESSVERAIGYGSIEIKQFEVNSDHNEVCFQNAKVIVTGKKMEDYVIEIELLKVDSDFCIEPEERKIKVKLEGLGDSVKISPAQ